MTSLRQGGTVTSLSLRGKKVDTDGGLCLRFLWDFVVKRQILRLGAHAGTY